MKKRITVIAVIAVAAAAAGIVTAACLLQNGEFKAVNTTGLSIGEKYLAELNYEQATATLQHVITVEPNNTEAYLALSKAYRYMGDIDTARKTLENGYGVTNSRVIEREIQELTGRNTSASGQTTTQEADFVEIADHNYRTDTTELVLRECGLTDSDMQKLSSFTKLERLDISGNGIIDISAVAKLTTLKKFYAANNAVTDVSPLADLKQLEYIGMRSNRIANANELFTLGNLKYLHLSDNKLTAVSDIGGSLKLLYLAGNQISDVSAVKGASLLYYDISGNPGNVR